MFAGRPYKRTTEPIFKKYSEDPISMVIAGTGSPRSTTAYQIKAKADDILENTAEYRHRIGQGKSAYEVSEAKGRLLGSYIAPPPPHPTYHTQEIDVAKFNREEAAIQDTLRAARANIDALDGLLAITAPGAPPSAPPRYSRFSKVKKDKS